MFDFRCERVLNRVLLWIQQKNLLGSSGTSTVSPTRSRHRVLHACALIGDISVTVKIPVLHEEYLVFFDLVARLFANIFTVSCAVFFVGLLQIQQEQRCCERDSFTENFLTHRRSISRFLWMTNTCLLASRRFLHGTQVVVVSCWHLEFAIGRQTPSI